MISFVLLYAEHKYQTVDLKTKKISIIIFISYRTITQMFIMVSVFACLADLKRCSTHVPGKYTQTFEETNNVHTLLYNSRREDIIIIGVHG